MRILIIALIAVLAGAPAALVLTPHAAAQEVRNAPAVPFLSGGIGETERAAMLAAERDYNLKLTFAAADGAYLADVAVRISDAQGAQAFEHVVDGPLLLVRLPAGSYRIAAVSDGREQHQQVTVPPAGLRSLIFRW